MQVEAGFLLQITDHAEQVPRLGIATRPEHPDQALGRRCRLVAQFLEANCRLDIVPKDRLAAIDVTAKHSVDSFA